MVQGLKVYIHSCNTTEWTAIQNVWYTLCVIQFGTEHSSEIAYANICICTQIGLLYRRLSISGVSYIYIYIKYMYIYIYVGGLQSIKADDIGFGLL